MSSDVTILQPGMENAEVSILQDELIDLGYMTLEEKNTRPGRFGPITERALKRFQSDNHLTESGIYDLPSQALIRQLNAGVQFGSEGGVVLPMQERLVAAGKLKQEQLNTGPGRFGELTRNALTQFQTDNQLTANGVLTDTTYRVLYQLNVPRPVPAGDNREINVILRISGEGFKTFLREPGGATQVGTQATINALEDLAKSWHQEHSEVDLQYGHISRMGGGRFFSTVNPGTLAHETHRDGRTVDIRPIREDNLMSPTDIKSSSFDPVRTKELILMIRAKHPRVDIIFNHKPFIRAGLTRPFRGHNDHLHVHLR